MRKETLIKLFVVVVVVAFVIEMIAIPFLGGTATKTSVATVSTISGTAEVEAQITGVDSAIIVQGNDPKLSEVKKQLTAQKLITFTTPVDNTTTLYNLVNPSAKDNVTAALKPLNVSLFMTVTLTLPASIDFVTSQGTHVNVSGTDFNYQLSPDFSIGDSIKLSIDGSAQVDPQTNQATLISLSGIRIVPETKTGIRAVGTVGNITSSVYVISVPWESRLINQTKIDDALTGLEGTPTYRYSQKSYILLNASQAEFTALSTKGIPFITQVSPPDTISISTNFSDRDAVVSALGSLANRTYFPPSVITVEYNRTNASFDEQKAQSDIDSAVQKIGAGSISYSERVTVLLPELAFDDSGANYTIPDNSSATLVVSGRKAVGDNVSLVFDASMVGHQVSRISYIQEEK